MINDAPHIQFAHKAWDVRQSPVDPLQLLLTIVLTASTSLPPSEVDAIKNKILNEGFKVYVHSGVTSEMLAAMRVALLRAESERDQSRTRADHFENELQKAHEYIRVIEAELEKKRRTLGFLEQGLLR